MHFLKKENRNYNHDYQTKISNANVTLPQIASNTKKIGISSEKTSSKLAILTTIIIIVAYIVHIHTKFAFLNVAVRRI